MVRAGSEIFSYAHIGLNDSLSPFHHLTTMRTDRQTNRQYTLNWFYICPIP